MRRAILAFLGLVLAVLACTPSALAAKRVALVIGINDYPKLKTPDDPELMQLDKAVADGSFRQDRGYILNWKCKH